MTSSAPGAFLRKLLSPQQVPFTVGVAIIALFAGAVLFGLNVTHGMPVVERKTVKVAFDDVSGLNTGDDVRIASSRVGFVQDLRLENGKAIAVLKIDDPKTKLYANSKAASVSGRSALGQKFIDIDPGSPETGDLRDETTIQAENTESAQDVNQLFNIFDSATRDATSSTLKQLGGGSALHSKDLNDAIGSAPGILKDVATISRTVSVSNGSSLVGMLRSADTLAARFRGREKEVAALTRQLGTSLDALAVDEGVPVEETVARAPETLDAARSALDALNGPLADTEVAMTKLRPGAVALGRAVPDLRAVLRDGVKPLRKLPGVNKKAEPAVEESTVLVKDARPLAHQLIKTGDSAAPPVSVFGRYAEDISHYFTAASGSLAHGDDAGNWWRVMLLAGAESVAGVPTPLVSRNAYPEPGQAAKDKSVANGGNR